MDPRSNLHQEENAEVGTGNSSERSGQWPDQGVVHPDAALARKADCPSAASADLGGSSAPGRQQTHDAGEPPVPRIAVEYTAAELEALIRAGSLFEPYPALREAIRRSEQALAVEEGSCGSVGRGKRDD